MRVCVAALLLWTGALLPGCDGGATRAFTLSVWCWEHECVEDARVQASLLGFCRDHALASVYLQLSSEYERPTQFAALSALAGSARDQDLALWWAAGRPEWVLPENRSEPLAAITNAAAINGKLTAAGQLPITSIIYDVEPYLLDEWSDDPAKVIADYDALAAALHEQARGAGLELWLALPFWYETRAAAEAPSVGSVLEHADGLVLMTYRNDAEDIEQASAPMVDSAQAQHVPVVIAVETQCVSPSYTSFCSAGRSGLEWSLSELRARLDRKPTVLGFAVHEFSSWQALRGP